jgi:hypothetical protein
MKWEEMMNFNKPATVLSVPVIEIAITASHASRPVSRSTAAGAITRNLNLVKRSLEVPSGSCSRRSPPWLERLLAEDAEAAARGEMALDVESVLDGGMNRQKALG